MIDEIRLFELVGDVWSVQMAADVEQVLENVSFEELNLKELKRRSSKLISCFG